MKETKVALLEKDVEVEKKLEKANELKKASQADEQTNEVKTQNIVVQTPNYDLIPELPPEKKKRVLHLSQQVAKEQPKQKPKTSLWKKLVAGGVIALTIGLGVSGAVELSSAVASYNAAQSEYSVNVANLIKNIASVDSGNKASELIETYPKELESPQAIKKDSNWFDRFCNFLSGLFGG